MEMKDLVKRKGKNGKVADAISSPNNQAYSDEVMEVNNRISAIRTKQMRAYQDAGSVRFYKGG